MFQLVEPKQMGGQRLFSLKSTLFFFFFFYNPGPLCQSLKAECKANCLNKPDYRYWIPQSVSPRIAKNDSLRQFDSVASVWQIQSLIEYFCGFSVTQTGAAWFLRLVPSFIRSHVVHTHFLGFSNPWQRQTQASGSSVNCLGTILLGREVNLSLWHDDLAAWGLLR